MTGCTRPSASDINTYMYVLVIFIHTETKIHVSGNHNTTTFLSMKFVPYFSSWEKSFYIMMSMFYSLCTDLLAEHFCVL